MSIITSHAPHSRVASCSGNECYVQRGKPRKELDGHIQEMRELHHRYLGVVSESDVRRRCVGVSCADWLNGLILVRGGV
jgi:hypothetical protein